MQLNLIDEIKSLNQLIIKRLFHAEKNGCIKCRPKPLQMELLKYIIDHRDEKICQKDLENKFQISKSAISYALDAMEKNNIITRSSSEEDSRKKYISLTEKSIEMNKKLKIGINKVNEELLSCLTVTEQQEFIRMIHKLKNHMKEGL